MKCSRAETTVPQRSKQKRGWPFVALLEVQNLTVSFLRYAGGFRRQTVRVIEGIDLSIDQGEILAVIGASGAGKSLLAHALIGILPDNAKVSGTIRYLGETLDAAKLAAIRGKEIAFVPQSVACLDPLMRVGTQVRWAVRGKDPIEEQRHAFRRYRLAENVERMYPYQLSGGMARRVLLSTATVSGARLIVADEPTPGVHPDDLNEVLCRMRELADEGCAVLLITHDLESALSIADRVAVFYAGTVVETAPSADFSGDGERLRHPYSRALWRALPQNDFAPIAGTQPEPGELPAGCPFAPRCPLATSACENERPELRAVRGGTVRCIHAS